MNRAAFLDRDGVINRKAPEGQYVTRWEEMHFLPGVAQAIAVLNRSGFRVIIVTNQRCVAKGLITAAELEFLHEGMCRKLAADGATVDGVFYCPHEKQPACACRKPAPGMLLDAARVHQIDLAASWMIGDSEIDVEAGRNAGCRTALLSTSPTVDGKADLVAGSLLEAIHGILKHEGSAGDGQGARPHQNQGANAPGPTEQIKTGDSKHYAAAYPKVLAAVCVAIACVLLIAGLWPFHTPRNEVDWLRSESGLHFGRYGVAVSKAVFPENSSKDGLACSLEIWVAPSATDEVNTLLAFNSSPDPSRPFSLEQRGRNLVLRQFVVEPQGLARMTLKVEGVFREGTRSFVSITSDGQNTSVYVNNVLAEFSPTFGISTRNLAGQLVVANSTTHDSWSGEFLGLATYHRQLTPAQVARHYQSWTKNQEPSVSQDEAAAALYLFKEREGRTVHNRVDASTDLAIPARYSVLHPGFLSLPWREYYSDWGYWQDVGINIAGFIPFGFSVMAYLSLVRKHSQPVASTIVLGFVVSLSIETLQGLLPTRSSGMTDIITNTLGTGIGVLFYRSPAVQAGLTAVGRYAGSFLDDHAVEKRARSIEVGSEV